MSAGVSVTGGILICDFPRSAIGRLGGTGRAIGRRGAPKALAGGLVNLGAAFMLDLLRMLGLVVVMAGAEGLGLLLLLLVVGLF